jgi:hydrogenase maturation protease
VTDVVVGVGNPIMTDDGVGKAVVEALESAGVTGPDSFRAVHAGTTAFLALEALSGADRAVVVDAVDIDAEPGSIHRFRFADGSFGDHPDVMMHDFSFAEALTTAAAAYDLPEDILLLGVVPASLEPGLELSPTVEGCLPRIVDAVLAELFNPGERTAKGESMQGTWYCADCEREIDQSQVAVHEKQGHEVKGKFRPERLLEQSPWEVGDEETAKD